VPSSLRMTLSCLAALALAAAAHAAAPPAAGSQGASGDVFPFKVSEHTLDNGFKIIAIPYDSPGTVAFVTVVRTGSRDEVEANHSGFAHFFEHMMFRGTDKTPGAKYTQALKVMGADSNASTNDDFTEYHIVGPASELARMMELESDRFENLKYDEEAFRTEALAVLGEYNKDASNPFQPVTEKLRDLAFTRHTYKHTTIGFLADVKAMPGYYEYSKQFLRRFYRPENCILVVVGDVQPPQVFALAQRYYGGWQRGYQAPPVAPEPPQNGSKSGHLDWPTPIHPLLVEAYHIPAFSTRNVDAAALDLIGQLLFSESAPLYQEVVNDKQWVDFLQGGPDIHRDPYLFVISARAKSDELIPQVRQTVGRSLAELAATPVDAARLERIKAHLRHAFALSLNTPAAVAFQVAQYLSLSGDVQSINRSFEQYQKVTPADIQRVAKSVFRPENETVVTLSHPAGKGEQPAAGKPQGGGRHD
jgi:zinc protease